MNSFTGALGNLVGALGLGGILVMIAVVTMAVIAAGVKLGLRGNKEASGPQ